MKEEKKEIKSVKYETIFVAVDGTEFKDRESCARYENSARCVLYERLKDMSIRTNVTEMDLFDCGNDDNDGIVVEPHTKDDIDVINTYICNVNNYTGREIPTNMRVTDDLIGKRIIIFVSYDGDWCWWFSKEQLIDKISKYFEPKEEPKEETK